MADEQLGRFRAHRGDDGIQRERTSGGFPVQRVWRARVLYRSRHAPCSSGNAGFGPDWQRFMEHLKQTLASFELADTETADELAFIESTKLDIVEV